MSCECGMYKDKGICWHTGYQPSFSDPKPDIPDHESSKRSRNRMRDKSELKEQAENPIRTDPSQVT